ncbi:integrin alpha-IIb [Engraulis encrasicolus]|uniref:integrin alpha-IIb n=1 Tax=Engraulis encrasicolus TaxID=184585 RepID=UPI002FD6DDA6
MERGQLAGGIYLQLVVLIITPGIHHGLNINQINVTVFSGPEDSYFGFAVDFQTTGQGVSLVVGAPHANSTQAGVKEGGMVYRCNWAPEGGTCTSIDFDLEGDEEHTVHSGLKMKGSKSHQWFGATVRTTEKYILACAPLFHWNVIQGLQDSQNTPVGNCLLKDVATSRVSVYSPCRDVFVESHYKTNRYENDKRYCEAGFSLDITKNGAVVFGAPGSLYFQGQIFTATLEELAAPRRPVYLPSKGVGRESYLYGYQDTHYDAYSGYSVATGNLTGHSSGDYLVGFPNDRGTSGTVRIFNGDLELKQKLFGTQVAAYFGYAVTVTDINNDGGDDILIGAPLFIEQLANQKQQEVGRVYIYLQQIPFRFSPRPEQMLTGPVPYGRFGTSIAPLGDLDKDGYNDVAVGAPSTDGQGRVFIYMGQSGGLSPQALQVLQSPFPATLHAPSAFGFTLRGGTDVDDNGYPDLIVGDWGASKIAVYRTLAVVKANSQLTLFPDVLNPEEKSCSLTKTKKAVTCFTVMMCISLSGHRIPKTLDMNVELQLDKKKTALTRRTLLLHSGQPQESTTRTIQTAAPNTCFNVTAYLRPESEFKDKLSPIFISVSFTLTGLQDGILQGQTSANAQTHIILDCGPDNNCIPDLKLAAFAETARLLIGDDSPALLVMEAENKGEGAYETELYISPPPSTHFQGMAADREGFSRLNCAQRKDNGSVIIVCDLGNPMPADHKLKAALLFSVGNLENVDRDVSFRMQIKSKNSHNPDSEPVLLKINVTASATLEMQGASSPMEVVLPIAKWEPVEWPTSLEQIGPYVEHVYMLRNLGPSSVNVKVVMEFPTQHQEVTLLYAFASDAENFLSCSANNASMDPHGLVRIEPTANRTTHGHHIHKRYARYSSSQKAGQTIHVNCSSGDPSCVTLQCEARGLKRHGIAVVKVMAHLWVNTFLKRPNEDYILQSTASYQVEGMPSKIQPEQLQSGQEDIYTSVVWREETRELPVWWIIVAVAAGLLLLALLSYIFWKVGFFKRNRPPCDDDDDDDIQHLNPETTYESVQPSQLT